MNKKKIKNKINKKNFKKALIFFLVILLTTCLPLASFTSVFIVETEDESNRTLHNSENASWTANGLSICPAPDDQWYPQLISDGAGGAIITWHDYRAGATDANIYAQRINSAGVTQWDTNGTLICNVGGNQLNPEIASDGAGGAIITWTDERVASTQNDVYVQRINSSGAIQWDPNGILICNADYYQIGQQIITDGVGGAIIAWEDYRTFATTWSDIFAQKINSAGVTQWDDNGTLISNVPKYQRVCQLVSDGSEGAIITWEDNRNDVTTNFDIYAQKIDSAGNTQWDDNGTIICNENGNQFNPQIASDGTGGVIITWQDQRFGTNDIYAQKICSAGLVQWDKHWTLICNATGNQMNPQITSDGAGGAIITWQDERVGPDEDDIYTQKISTVGVAQWDDNGSIICNAIDNQLYPQLTSDDAGGAIITWQDLRFGVYDIYTQKINSSGVTEWDDNGNLICNAINDQWYPQITSDGAEGAIIVWQDQRVGPDEDDIYAQKIADPPPSPSIVINSPTNSTIFISRSGLFNVTVSAHSAHTMWYTINGGPINIMWYTMGGDEIQTFTVITTVNDTNWATLANNTLLIVTFYINDTSGNQASSSVQIYVVNPTSGSGGGGINIPGFDLFIIGLISVTAIFTLVKMHERKKKRIHN